MATRSLKLGEIWKVASKKLEETNLMEKILDDLLQLRGVDNEEIIKYAKEHIDKTHFYHKIGEYVDLIALNAIYEHY